MQSQTNLNRINCKGQGHKSSFEMYEKEILSFIINTRKLNLPVTTKLVIAKITSLYKEFSEKSRNAKLMSIYRFLKRNNLSLRKSSHIGQPLNKNAKDEYYNFLYEVVKKRKINNINDNFDLIINCDETPLFFEMVDNKTIDNIGEKNIVIATNGSEKKHITLILGITASGKKLKPLLIFKGESDGNINKKLLIIPIIKNKEIVVTCQKSACCT